MPPGDGDTKRYMRQWAIIACFPFGEVEGDWLFAGGAIAVVLEESMT